MASKLQKLGKSEIERRVKIKQKIRTKRKVKSFIKRTIFNISILTNVYFLSLPYHAEILTNINEIYTKVLPIMEALIKQLPL